MTFPPVPAADWYRRARYLPGYADQLPATEYGLTSAATGMTALYAAVADRNTARVDIPVIGDSVTEGQGATAFTSRWIWQANRAIRAAYPTVANGAAGGLGFIPIASTGETSYAWPVTAAGSPETFDLGPVRGSSNTTAATTWTWTAPAGTTSVRIMYYDGAVDGEFSYKVGSGAATDVSNTETVAELLTASIPITSGEVLTITWVSGNVFIDGLVHYAGDEDSGITLHGCGHFGWCSGTEGDGWNQAETYGLNWAQCFANGFPALAALGIMLGINDSDPGNGDRTAAQYQSDMQDLITTIRGAATPLATVPLLLIAEYQPDITVVDPGGWPAYVAALRNVAAWDGNSRVIDLSYRLPPNNGSAPYWADDYHPTNLGHALVGEITAAGLRIA